MKKLIGTVAVAALLATAAFAEGITFGSWGRALWIVGNAANVTDSNGTVDGNTVTSWLGQSWGGAGPRTALSVHGSSENVGFALDIFANGTALGVGDNALVWVKPISWLQFGIGKFDWNILRSDAAFGLWGWDRIGPVGVFDEEGWIFGDLLDKNVNVVLTPIEGLTIGYGFNPWTADTSWSKLTNGGNNTNNNVVGTENGNRFVDQLGRTSAFAAGYTIANVGTIKLGVQAQGKNYNSDGEKKDRVEIDAAFELTAIEKVYIAVGARIPLGGTYTQKTIETETVYAKDAPVYVNLYGRINAIDNLGINLLAGFKIGGGDYKASNPKADGAFGFRFGGEVDYTFSNGIGVFGEVEFANGIWMANNSDSDYASLGFGLGLTKGFSNGVFGVAFEGATNAYGRNALESATDFAWEVPVKIEYWF